MARAIHGRITRYTPVMRATFARPLGRIAPAG